MHVLITSGGSGIDKAIASAFADDGYKFWGVDINQSALDDCPDAWEKSCCDCANAEAMADVFSQLDNNWDRLDALCANTVIAWLNAKLEEVGPEAFTQCVLTNANDAFLATKYAAPIISIDGHIENPDPKV